MRPGRPDQAASSLELGLVQSAMLGVCVLTSVKKLGKINLGKRVGPTGGGKAARLGYPRRSQAVRDFVSALIYGPRLRRRRGQTSSNSRIW